MFFLKNNVPRWVIVLIDLLTSAFALIFAYVIRFDLKADAQLIKYEWNILSRSIVIYFLVKFLVFLFFRVHKGIVRHTSTADVKRIFLANFVSSIIFLILGMLRWKFVDDYFLFPTSVLLMEFLASFMLMLTGRFAIKLLYLESLKPKEIGQRVLIYGAGISGLMTKRTIEKDAENDFQLIGFLDDNKKMEGTRLEGLNIYHTSKIGKLHKEEGIGTVIIAIQNPEDESKTKLVDYCFENGINVQKVPSTSSWINGEFSTKQLQKIKIEDLLGRTSIRLNEDIIQNAIDNEVVLVTGAAGSIGSGIVNQLLRYNPEKLILLDSAESPLYNLVNELLANNKKCPIETVIGDIRNFERMKNVFETYKPQFVFHAAAYKHVPLMEENPSEALLTNVKGTKNLVDLSLLFSVKKFVMISTDKAVNPTNVMGASKRIAEMYVQVMNQKGITKFVTTRFGNVLGSNGSVIPLFQKQIENGGPITLTDERITRFFMTIPEACQLVLDAGVMGEGGEIFVFDMGESVKIIDLAKKMIKLSGLQLDKDIEIKVTGLRPGEKLYEELLSEGEKTIPAHHPKILKAKIKENGLEIIPEINALIELFETQNNELIVRRMKDLVPEFKSNNSIYEKLDNLK